MKSVSGKVTCMLLEANGWVMKRIRGSQYIYAKDGTDAIITVPVKANRDLKKGTLASILKTAELSEDDL